MLRAFVLLLTVGLVITCGLAAADAAPQKKKAAKPAAQKKGGQNKAGAQKGGQKKPAKKAGGDFRAVLARLDKDGNQELSIKEFTAGMNAAQQKRAKAVFAAMQTELDPQSSGRKTVSREEFKSGFTKYQQLRRAGGAAGPAKKPASKPGKGKAKPAAKGKK